MNRRDVIKGLIIFFVFFVAVYSVMFLWRQSQANFDAFRQFNWWLMPLVLFSVLINFVLRELKWDFFRRRANIEWQKPIPRSASWLIFFSGYSMCISPGRFGELIKPALYKEYYNSPLKKTVPLVFCERLTDLLGMVLMCLLTIGFYFRSMKGGETTWSDQQLLFFFVLSSAFLAGLIGMARWRTFVMAVLDKAAHVPKLSKVSDKLRGLYQSTYPLLTFYNLSTMSVFAAVSWCFECLAMYMVCYGLGITDLQGGPVTMLHCIFIFCISSILGALAFIFPGGMGPVEVMMKVLLINLGVPGPSALAAMFLTRFSTLFFGAVLGFFFLWVTARYHRDADLWGHLSEAVEADEPDEAGGSDGASRAQGSSTPTSTS